MFKSGSVESRGIVIEDDHLKTLDHFAQRFDLKPVFAHAVCIADDKIIHLFMLQVADSTISSTRAARRFRRVPGPLVKSTLSDTPVPSHKDL